MRHQVHLSAGGESFFQSHGMMGGIHDHCVCRPLSICHCCIRGSPLRTGVQKCPYTSDSPGQGKPLPDTLHARSFSLLTPSVGRPPYTLSGYPPCLMFAHHRPVQTEEELAPQSVPRPSHRRVIEISNYSCGGHCQLFSNAVNWVGSRTSSFCSCLTPAGCVMTLLIDMGEKLLLPSPNNPMQLKYT